MRGERGERKRAAAATMAAAAATRPRRRPMRARSFALALAALAAAVRGSPAPGDDDGLVSTWVLHFDGEMRVACLPAYKDLLRELHGGSCRARRDRI